MTTALLPRLRPGISDIPLLEEGDHLDQPTFHTRYLAMPSGIRAELIGGVVYMPSPLRLRHGESHGLLLTWLNLYRGSTPSIRVADNATTILGEDSEPQPDAILLVEGGQTHVDSDDYVVGPPEFVAEVASSTESFDLHTKKLEYERHGIREYLVLLVRVQQALWFVRDGNQFKEHPADADGIFHSPFLPGLWLDPAALLRGDTKRVQEVLNLGLTTPEHAKFVVERAGK